MRRPFAAALGIVCLLPAPAFAQALDRPLSHLQRTQWTGRDGLPSTGVTRVVRGADGYLWLGSHDGLFRFDGVRFVRMDSSHSPVFADASARSYSTLDESHPLPARQSLTGLTLPLLVDRRGALWVATPDGRVLRHHEGAWEVAVAHDASVGRVNQVVEDGEGRLWAVGSIGARLYALRDGRLRPPELPAGVPDSNLVGLTPDTGRGLLFGTMREGLWHVSGTTGRRVLEPSPIAPSLVRPYLQTRDGTVWLVRRTLMQVRDGRETPLVALEEGRITALDVIELSDGAVVIGTRGDGLLRWKDGVLERLTSRDGLAAANVHQLLVDQEGSLWVASDEGLTRMRATPFATIGTHNGLPFAAPSALLLDHDGFLWSSSSATSWFVHRLDPARLAAGVPSTVVRVAHDPREGFFTPFASSAAAGVIALHSSGGLARLRDGRFEMMAVPGLRPARPELALTARDGTVWLSLLPRGLGRVRGDALEPVRVPELSRSRIRAFAEDARGHLWIALADTALVLELEGERVVRRLDAAAGLGEPISTLAVDTGGTVWGGGAATGSLVRVHRGRVSAARHPGLARLLLGATPVIVPHGADLWFASGSGIARVADAGTTGAEEVWLPVPRVYGAPEGLAVGKLSRLLFGGAVTDRDGRIWFSTPGGLAVVAPGRVPRNDVAPRVHVEEVHVGGEVVHAAPGSELRIAPDPERVEIRFTATALLVPERVRIEYQLVGADRSWVDGSEARLASYTNLRPGRYTFRVRAWNEDGVPAADVASLAFRVLPTWYESAWFAGLGVLALMAMGFGAALAWQRARSRRREDRLQARFEATLEERTRVARELHDTLLSGFTGITLQLQALQRGLRDAPERGAERLNEILASADEALREARLMIWDMRAASRPGVGLVEALERVARDAVQGTEIDVQVTVLGEPRPLAPTHESTLRRVGREAVVNAARHASARHVRLELAFEPELVCLTVTDDGRGLSDEEARAANAAGHWGLAGMRERAERAGGRLSVRAAAGAGTTVHVALPTANDV